MKLNHQRLPLFIFSLLCGSFCEERDCVTSQAFLFPPKHPADYFLFFFLFFFLGPIMRNEKVIAQRRQRCCKICGGSNTQGTGYLGGTKVAEEQPYTKER